MERSRTHFEQIPVEVVKKIVGLEDKERLKYPEWQQPLQEALVEFDPDKLKHRVADTETAIYKRLQAISQDSDHAAERQAIDNALASLRFLKRGSLRYPDWAEKG